MKKIKSAEGFTLIELMIAVVVLGIISALAIPSYVENVKRGRRAEVRGVLLEDAQYMERFLTENNRYNLRTDGVTAPTLPILTSPRSSSGTSTMYDISFLAGTLTSTTYTLQAIPKAGNAMANDACGTYVINNLGAKSSLNNTTPTLDCWSK